MLGVLVRRAFRVLRFFFGFLGFWGFLGFRNQAFPGGGVPPV